MMPGAYTPFKPVTERNLDLFREKLGPVMGVSYEPLLIAVQNSVNPPNYMYICNATVMTTPPKEYLASIEFFNDDTVHIKELDLHK